MRKLKKLLSATLAVCMLASLTAINAFAAEDRTKISSVKLKIESNISVGDDSSDVTVTTTTSNVVVEDTNVTNDDGDWGVGDTPKVEITLSADSDYYFSLSKSNISLSGSGANVSTTTTKDSKSTLVIVVKLDKLTASSDDLDVENIAWDDDSAVGTWDENDYASKYEVKLYRGSSTVMSVVSTTDTSFDFSNYITKSGTYTFKVRGIYSTKKGSWNESEDWDVDSDMVSSIGSSSSDSPSTGSSNTPGTASTSTGAWLKDSVGWWYCNADRSYTTSNWQKINNTWYYFNATGYMVTGWVQTSGKWYYCGSNGAMLANTTTPDGYRVDASGAWIQ